MFSPYPETENSPSENSLPESFVGIGPASRSPGY